MNARTPGRLAATALAVAFVGRAGADDKVLFNRDVRPILSDNCYACHGPDKGQRKAKLRLDVWADAVARAAVVPGKPGESTAIARVLSGDADEVMPPPDSHKKLTAVQKETLRKWVEQGAEHQGHWAYEPPVRPPVPAGTNAIDHLIRQRAAAAGLTPAPEADRRTLARRLSFDLLGLPPAPADVDAFVADKAPDSYERLVEKLLARPHYGERMAVAWLDVVRFADTIGYHSDNPHNVWPYRDYVIRSFNQNKPFDAFTTEQLAGDLLPNATTDQRVGSAFNHLLLTTEEGGAQGKDYEARMLADRVRAVGTAWLGQTFGCCQCHDHKFDPTSIRDFYSLGAFFADIQEPTVGRRPEGMALPDATQAKEMARRKAAATAAAKAAMLLGAAPAAAATKAVAAIDTAVPKVLVTQAGGPRTVRILHRGNFLDESGPVVTPALPTFLVKSQPATPDGKRPTRLDLARWVAARDNPLTARVFVNRLWRQFLGTGLSKSVEDFGAQGEWPTHPELLDWLAVEFMDSGWDVKHMARLMLLSRTYRQSATASAEALARDPANRLLSHQSRFRLDAEFVRDNALTVAGLLVPTVGGPSVKPYQPDGYWENLNFPARTWVADAGDGQYRRGMYTWWQRSFPHPSQSAFDAPTREECSADRPRSNIPQQALVLLNDPTYVEAARAFAARIVKAGGADTAARLTWAYRQALQRAPRPDEAAVIAALVEKHRREYAADKASAAAVLKVGFTPPPADLDPAELAAWTNAARVLLNLHETITRN